VGPGLVTTGVAEAPPDLGIGVLVGLLGFEGHLERGVLEFAGSELGFPGIGREMGEIDVPEFPRFQAGLGVFPQGADDPPGAGGGPREKIDGVVGRRRYDEAAE